METIEEERSFASQIHLWCILGPFFTILGASLALLTKFPMQQPFFWVSIVCILFCCRGKIPGFIFSSVLVVTLIGYSYYTSLVQDNIWFLGVGFSVLLSLLITSLSYAEIDNFITELSEENAYPLSVTEEQLKELTELREKIHATGNEKKELNEQLDALKQDKEQLSQNRLQEIEELQAKLDLLKNYPRPEQLQELREVIQGKDQEIMTMQHRLKSFQEELRILSLNYSNKEKDYQKLKEENDSHNLLIGKAQQEQLTCQSMIQELNDHIETLDREKDLLEKTLARLQGELEVYQEKESSIQKNNEHLHQQLLTSEESYLKQIQILEQRVKQFEEKQKENEIIINGKTFSADKEHIALTAPSTELKAVNLYQQLREQFAEKSAVLDETRRQLFAAQEKILAYELSVKEKNCQWEPLEESMYQQYLKLFHKLETVQEEHQQEIEQLHDIISFTLLEKELCHLS